MDFDLFISHASEDKESFVEPLVQELQRLGLTVWYDRFELTIGDSLRQKIDEGLAKSRFGVVVLSTSFFAKSWPQNELDGLLSRQNRSGQKVILPIWHGAGIEEVEEFSPILSGCLAGDSSAGVKIVARQLNQAVQKDVESPPPQTVFQTGSDVLLRDKCLEIARQADRQAWLQILEYSQESVPDMLLDWKPVGETAIARFNNGEKDGLEEWRNAVYQAIHLSLPAFVPIWAAIEGGNRDFWRDSISILRRLALLADRMQGGPTWVCEIGASMLYISGTVGIAISVRSQSTQFISEWLDLPFSSTSMYGNEEVKWTDIGYALCPPGGWGLNRDEPFEFILSLSDRSEVGTFFRDKDQLRKCLIVSNLIQSMKELGRNLEFFLLGDNSSISIRPSIQPLWIFTDHSEFRDYVTWFFGDSSTALSFIYGVPPNIRDGLDLATMWSIWKKWKRICANALSDHQQFDTWFHTRYLLLPGEPTES